MARCSGLGLPLILVLVVVVVVGIRFRGTCSSGGGRTAGHQDALQLLCGHVQDRWWLWHLLVLLSRWFHGGLMVGDADVLEHLEELLPVVVEDVSGE